MERAKQISKLLCKAMEHPVFSDWFMYYISEDFCFNWMKTAITASADRALDLRRKEIRVQ